MQTKIKITTSSLVHELAPKFTKFTKSSSAKGITDPRKWKTLLCWVRPTEEM